MKHSPEPLCPSCGEDRPTCIDTRATWRGVEKFCNTCSKVWLVTPPPDVRDVNGVEMTDP